MLRLNEANSAGEKINSRIQIQPMLRLNGSKRRANFLLPTIQIQPMLRLNILLWCAGNAPATNSNTTNVKVKRRNNLAQDANLGIFKYNQC